MKKIVIDQAACVMCGACTLQGTLIEEDAEGRPVPVHGGVLAPAQESEAAGLVTACPQQAIRIETDAVSLAELKALLRQPLVMPPVDAARYTFNKAEYSLPTLPGRGEYRYIYRNDDIADREGLKDFRDNVYSQRAKLAQQVVASYKQTKLEPFLQYAEEPGNYLYETNQLLSKKLGEYVAMAESALGRKLDLPSGFTDFHVTHNKVQGWSFKYLDEGVADRVANACEPYDWFDCWIDDDYRTEYKTVSHWFGDDTEEEEDKYCYKIARASQTLNEQILNECQNIIPEVAREKIESSLSMFTSDIQKEWKTKTETLLRLLPDNVPPQAEMASPQIAASSETLHRLDTITESEEDAEEYVLPDDDAEEYDIQGYDKDGYDREGYDKNGFDRDGYTVIGSKYDREGYDKNGHDKDGFDRDGCYKPVIAICGESLRDTDVDDEDGFNREGRNREGYDKNGFDRDGCYKPVIAISSGQDDPRSQGTPKTYKTEME